VLDGIAAYAGEHPERFFIGLVVVSALVYLPMAAVFAPWYWIEVGPFAFQPAIAPQYTVYFFAGLAVGTLGIDRGFLAADAMLAQRWARWLVAAFAAFALWVAAAGLIESGYDTVMLHLVRELSFVLFAASACLGSIAIFLRFATVRRPLLGAISDNAYGIYLFHYLFVIWAQYALLALDLPAIVKGVLVLAITLTLSWAVAAMLSGMPAGARLMRGERRTAMAASTERPQAEVQAEATE
jgi:surface polysaccharide O-acyltransferase-like enzyme